MCSFWDYLVLGTGRINGRVRWCRRRGWLRQSRSRNWPTSCSLSSPCWSLLSTYRGGRKGHTLNRTTSYKASHLCTQQSKLVTGEHYITSLSSICTFLLLLLLSPSLWAAGLLGQVCMTCRVMFCFTVVLYLKQRVQVNSGPGFLSTPLRRSSCLVTVVEDSILLSA